MLARSRLTSPDSTTRVGGTWTSTVVRLLTLLVTVLLMDSLRFLHVESLLTTTTRSPPTIKKPTTTLAGSVPRRATFRTTKNVAIPAALRGMSTATTTTSTTMYIGSPSEEEMEENKVALHDERVDSHDMRNSSTDTNPSFSTTTTTTLSTTSPQFGDVMPLKRPSQSLSSSSRQADDSFPSLSTFSPVTIADPTTIAIKRRNTQVAIVSVALACFQYLWQYLHPLEPISLLVQMQQQSSPVTVIGTTDKPTMVDFWAPWYVDRCRVCRFSGPIITHSLTPSLCVLSSSLGAKIANNWHRPCTKSNRRIPPRSILS